MRVPVHDEVGPMAADWACEPIGAEHEPQALRLAHERLLDG